MTATDTVTIRPAALTDAQIVQRMFYQYLLDVYEFGHDLLPVDSNTQYYWTELFAPSIIGGTAAIFLAYDGEKPVGAIFWCKVRPSRLLTLQQVALDHGAWVAPSYRRRGIATALRKRGLERLREIGVKELRTTIWSSNEAGFKSYEKINPERIGYIMKVSV